MPKNVYPDKIYSTSFIHERLKQNAFDYMITALILEPFNANIQIDSLPLNGKWLICNENNKNKTSTWHCRADILFKLPFLLCRRTRSKYLKFRKSRFTTRTRGV